jgi:hypothetical protein
MEGKARFCPAGTGQETALVMEKPPNCSTWPMTPSSCANLLLESRCRAPLWLDGRGGPGQRDPWLASHPFPCSTAGDRKSRWLGKETWSNSSATGRKSRWPADALGMKLNSSISCGPAPPWFRRQKCRCHGKDWRRPCTAICRCCW